MPSIGWLVSAHGFGHAARAAAVAEALVRQAPGTELHIVTAVPEWFFAQSLEVPFTVHPRVTDVGLVQVDALEVDLEGSARRLAELLDSPSALDDLTSLVDGMGCAAVVCDIAPLGIAVAGRLGLPSVLVENFTWDWIYEGYAAVEPRLGRHAELLAELFRRADLHLQTAPVCRPLASARQVAPISRRPRSSRDAVRRQLGVPPGAPMVLLSMGGVGWSYRSLDRLRSDRRAYFVVPGAADAERREGNLIALPHRTRLYHPDLVHASDLVVGKLGYSTVAEAYHAGVALAFVGRPGFRESAVLERFVRAEMAAVEIDRDELESSDWLDHVEGLLAAARPPGPRPQGADLAARLILERLSIG